MRIVAHIRKMELSVQSHDCFRICSVNVTGSLSEMLRGMNTCVCAVLALPLDQVERQNELSAEGNE